MVYEFIMALAVELKEVEINDCIIDFEVFISKGVTFNINYRWLQGIGIYSTLGGHLICSI